LLAPYRRSDSKCWKRLYFLALHHKGQNRWHR